jgi:uncharacterized protein (TIGR00730 family)
MINAVAIYCFENPSTDEDKVCTDNHRAAARLLGQELARRGITLVTGGMKNGLMGVITDASLEAGGKVVGVIPRHFPENNRHPGLTETIIVANALERKDVMMRRSDASCTLPGGKGTLAEYLHEEDISKEILKGYATPEDYAIKADRPVVLCNVDGFYNPLLEQYKKMGEVKGNTKDLDATTVVDPIAGSVYDALLELRVITAAEHQKIYSDLMAEHGVGTKKGVDKLIRPITLRDRLQTVKRSHRVLVGGALAASIGISSIPFWSPYLSHRPSPPQVDYMDMNNAINSPVKAEAGQQPPYQCSDIGNRIRGSRVSGDIFNGKPTIDESLGPISGCDAVTNKILALNVLKIEQQIRALPPLTPQEEREEKNAHKSMGAALSAMFAGLALIMCGRKKIYVAKIRPLFDRGARGVIPQWDV